MSDGYMMKSQDWRDRKTDHYVDFGASQDLPSFAECITKLTVTEDTDPNLLRDWGKDYHIHATVLMKKPKVRTPVPQKPPKREPTKRTYERNREKHEIRKEHTRSEGREI